MFCNFNGELRIYNGEDGSTNKVIQVEPQYLPVQTEPTLVDVNNDGRLDIIMANFYNINGLFVWAYDYLTEDTIWTNSIIDSSSFNAYHGGAVADIDNDGFLEYVIGSNNGLVRALNVEDGSVLWAVSIPQSNMAPVSIADLDGDGTLEVVVTNNDWITFDERIWVLDGLSGSVEWSFPTTFSSFRGCAISDLNGNGILDLVAGYFMGDVIAVEPYSGLLWQTNLSPYFPSGLPYFEVDHGPLIADFDKNGKIDVFVVAGYGTYTPDTNNTGKAFMLEAGDDICPEWLMFRQDVYRSGYLSQQEIDSSCTMLDVLSIENNANFTFYPNPAKETLIIESGVIAEIILKDMTGKIVLSQAITKGNNIINIFTVNNGIYLVSIKNNNFTSEQKIVIIK